MINLLRRVRKEYLKEGNYRIYTVYALGEVVLVMAGILLALQVDNWNQNRLEKQAQIDNLENFYFSLNEHMQIEQLIFLLDYAQSGERQWIEYLSGNIPYHDSLLNYGYFIGSVSFFSPNNGFYESLKQQGLETIANKTLRLMLSQLYEQNFPEIQNTVDYFYERFSEERIRYYKKYFVLGEEKRDMSGVNYLHFDYSMYHIEAIKNRNAMMSDAEFLEFVKISILFHQNLRDHLSRTMVKLSKVLELINNELSFARYGTPAKEDITLSLKGYKDVEQVLVSGEFNNWRPDGTMLRTPTGWERSFTLFPGIYEYKYIIVESGQQRQDGIWIMDPANPDSIYVPEVGSYNSVLTISE